MELANFASWKYGHEGRGVRSRRRYMIALALFIAGLVGWKLFQPAGVVFMAVAVLTILGTTRKIYLGPRYLICGRAIVYYGNVTRLTLLHEGGRLIVTSANGQNFVLERDRFPTNARKKDKITKNKAAKFDKVAGKIIERVRAATPGIDINDQPGQDPSHG